MEFEILIDHFGKKVGLNELMVDEQGTCSLGFDGMVVDLKVTGDERHLMLFGKVAALPEERLDLLLLQILGGNFLFQGTNGASLGLDVENKVLYLQQLEALDILDDEAFEKLLEGFANTLETWKNILDEFVRVTPAQEESPRKEQGGFRFGDDIGNFRV
ncbi:MAG: type III secretion system chaperone [Lentisphaeria bacterium]|nr:type III secretion system chaperone [Lentisphaeria bacterium]